MGSSNPAYELRNYIASNLGDSGDAFDFIHRPYIESILEELNFREATEFVDEIWDWEEYLLFELANPLLFSNSKFLDGDLLYCEIFARLNDPEKLSYLEPNLNACIHCIGVKECSLKLLKQIRDNLYFTMNYTGNIEAVMKLIDLLEVEIRNKS